jgi:hypothetical protein
MSHPTTGEHSILGGCNCHTIEGCETAPDVTKVSTSCTRCAIEIDGNRYFCRISVAPWLYFTLCTDCALECTLHHPDFTRGVAWWIVDDECIFETV